LWYRADASGSRSLAWARLGPLSTRIDLAIDPAQTVHADCSSASLAQQGGVAVSRLDGRGVSLSRDITVTRHGIQTASKLAG
jgi:hypothetical protein